MLYIIRHYIVFSVYNNVYNVNNVNNGAYNKAYKVYGCPLFTERVRTNVAPLV